MLWYHYVLVAITGLLVTLFVLTTLQAKKASVKISAEDFKQNMRKGQLIDVRRPQEFKSGHINGARNISVSAISREYGKLRSDKPVYLYCASGKRSSRAAMFLRAKGFEDIYELNGGIKSWNGPLK